MLIIKKEFLKTFPSGLSQKYYECQCECGQIINLSKSVVDSKKRVSCEKNSCNSRVKKNLNKKFGKLTTISYDSKKHKYYCRCECGGHTYANISKMRAGAHISCKCVNKEWARTLAHGRYKGKWVAAKKDILRSYKAGAKQRNYSFNISDEKFFQILEMPCFYCKIPNSLIWMNNQRTKTYEEPFKYNGVDRFDNNKGYEDGNCVPCCKQCNQAKRSYSITEWKDWIFRISQNINNF